MVHSNSGTFETLEAAEAYAAEFIAESNAADFAGIPATSYEITTITGIYGTRYVVVFAAGYSIVAGHRIAA